MSNSIIYFDTDQFKRTQIVSYDDVAWTCPDENIELGIQQSIKDEKQTPAFYNGPMVRVIGMDIVKDVLELKTQKTDYFHHIYTREIPDIKLRANPIYAAAMITTKDNKLVVGKNHDVGFGVGKLNIPAGNVVPYIDGPLNGIPSIYAALCRETAEEIGIFPETFENVRLGPVIRDKEHYHPTQMYEIELLLDSKSVKKHFEANNERKRFLQQSLEFAEIRFLDWNKESLLAALDEHNASIEIGNKGTLRGRISELFEVYCNRFK